MITEPLHVAVVNDKQLRFFRSPLNDGRPEFPWHSTDDLHGVFGLNRAQSRIMTTMWSNGPYEDVFHNLETSEGLVAIAPHCVAAAAISSLVEFIGVTFAEDIERAYNVGWIDACKKLHGGLRGARIAWSQPSLNFDQRRRPETLRTAIATAFFWPTRTTSFLPRVTPV